MTNYDLTITDSAGAWGNMTLTYPSGATEILAPVLAYNSLANCYTPTGSFSPLGRPYVVTGQPSTTTTGQWNWIQITYDDESSCTFQANAAYNPNTYLITKITDSQGNYISLNRTPGSNMLSSITDMDNNTLLSFAYSGALSPVRH